VGDRAAALGGDFLLFSPAIGYDFIHYDDNLYVYENDHVRQGLNCLAWRSVPGPSTA